MSVIAVAVGKDGVLAASDGVCYTYETGEIAGFVSKVILLPEYNCFIGSTGAGSFGVSLRWEIEQKVNSFDELVEDFADFCEIVHRKLFTNMWGYWDHSSRDTEISCVIGGWSDARQAYEAYRVVSYEKGSVDLSDGSAIRLEPFKLMPLPDALWCSYSPDTMEEFGLTPPLPNEETADIAARLVCAARATSGLVTESDGNEAFFMAGGFIQMTVIQQGHSQSWIAHRWPEDRLGEPIDPNGPERFPAWLRDRYDQAKAALEAEAAA